MAKLNAVALNNFSIGLRPGQKEGALQRVQCPAGPPAAGSCTRAGRQHPGPWVWENLAPPCAENLSYLNASPLQRPCGKCSQKVRMKIRYHFTLVCYLKFSSSIPGEKWQIQANGFSDLSGFYRGIKRKYVAKNMTSPVTLLLCPKQLVLIKGFLYNLRQTNQEFHLKQLLQKHTGRSQVSFCWRIFF